MILRLSGLVPESFSDGPGIRFVVFAQGCPHRCPGCHNPQTHPFDGGTLSDVEEILALLRKNPLLDGITLSGGEPFEQADAFGLLAERVRESGLNVVTYTGYRYEEITKAPARKDRMRLLRATDLLVDGRFEIDLRTEILPFRGSSNQRIIDVPLSLRENKPCCRDFTPDA